MTIPRLSEAQEFALLDHAAEAHGLESRDCPFCKGMGCRRCNGDGTIFTEPAPTCSDLLRPALPAHRSHGGDRREGEIVTPAQHTRCDCPLRGEYIEHSLRLCDVVRERLWVFARAKKRPESPSAKRRRQRAEGRKRRAGKQAAA